MRIEKHYEQRVTLRVVDGESKEKEKGKKKKRKRGGKYQPSTAINHHSDLLFISCAFLRQSSGRIDKEELLHRIGTSLCVYIYIHFVETSLGESRQSCFLSIRFRSRASS